MQLGITVSSASRQLQQQRLAGRQSPQVGKPFRQFLLGETPESDCLTTALAPQRTGFSVVRYLFRDPCVSPESVFQLKL